MSFNELTPRGTADFPIELYCIDKNHTRYEMASHWHSEIEIIRILSGNLQIKLNNTEYLAKKGDIIFINSETIHGALPKDCKYDCLVFHPEFLECNDLSCKFFIENIINHEYLINEFFSSDKKQIIDAVNNIFDEMNNKSSGYKFSVIGALYKLLGIIVDNHF